MVLAKVSEGVDKSEFIGARTNLSLFFLVLFFLFQKLNQKEFSDLVNINKTSKLKSSPH